MLSYDNDFRRLAAREHAQRLAHDMHRSRRPASIDASPLSRTSLGGLLRSAASLGRGKETAPHVAAHDA